MNWKAFTNTAAKVHLSKGASLLSYDGMPLDADVQNVTEDTDLFHQDGREIDPRKLREWLFQHRGVQGVSALWSVYDEEHDRSFAGLGKVVNDG